MDKNQWNFEMFKTHLENVDRIIKFHFQTIRQLNKAILTIASGSLIVSITLIKDVFPNPNNPDLLLYSIYSWIVTIILTLLASWLDSFAFEIQKNIENRWHNEFKARNYTNAPERDKNPFDKFTRAINYLIAVFFIAAFILLAIFFHNNFLK